jgi:hypothetical protein
VKIFRRLEGQAFEDAEEALGDVFTEPADVRAVQAGYLSLARKLR